MTALILALVNIFIGPLVRILALPVRVISFGLATLLINAAMLYLVSVIYTGFHLSGFLAALWGSLAITLVNMLADRMLEKPR